LYAVAAAWALGVGVDQLQTGLAAMSETFPLSAAEPQPK
jgi:hypothetical protein